MQFNYYAETDMLYIALREKASVESEEIRPGLVIDFDEEGKVVGIEVEDASKQADLSSLQAFSFPNQVAGNDYSYSMRKA